MREVIYAEKICKYVIVSCNKKINCISFTDSEPKNDPTRSKIATDLKKYFEGEVVDFSGYDINLGGFSDFERKVFNEVRNIPYGHTVTYGKIAKLIRNERAYRAVGGALRKNPVPIIIPCHRVVGKHSIGGYTPGKDIKQKLLNLER